MKLGPFSFLFKADTTFTVANSIATRKAIVTERLACRTLNR